MNFEQALSAMRRGEKIRREGQKVYMQIVNNEICYFSKVG